MGDVAQKEMFILNWVKSKVKQFVNSRFFLGLVCLAIGISWTYSWFQFQSLWQAYEETLRYLESSGVLVSAGAFATTGEASLVNTEREVLPPPLSLDEILDRISFLESNNGQTGLALTCKNKGLSNNYGYNPPTCFKNDGEAREAVKWQIEKWTTQGLSLEEMLFLYRSGTDTENQKYLSDFNKLN